VRYTTCFLAILALAAASSAADWQRTLSLSKPAAGIAGVVIEAGVGDVEVTAVQGGEITASVDVNPKKSVHLFGSSRDREELDSARLDAEMHGHTLHLRVRRGGDKDWSFGEDWTVSLPPGTRAEIKLGVGDVRVIDVTADVEVKVGVGDVRVEGTYANFGEIHAEAGVGGATLRTPEARTEGEGFIGHSLDATGPGKSSIEVASGVGDLEIRLR
jgi:hypothetical protein